MKTILISLLLFLMCGCTSRVPKLNGFIVESIVRFDNKNSFYYRTRETSIGISVGASKPCILLPSDMYHVGDTIKHTK